MVTVKGVRHATLVTAVIAVVIAGGSGKHSAVIPNCTFSRAVSRPIRTGHD